MTKTANTKPRSATFEDLRDARRRSAEVLGIAADGEAMMIHWLALPAEKIVEYLEREENTTMSKKEKYLETISDLSKSLITEDGEPLATEEQLLKVAGDTINTLMMTVSGITKEDIERVKNASGGAAGDASPTA